ncbi:MAG: PRC-barrel domain-containing protein [Pseudomonadota bacterium]
MLTKNEKSKLIALTAIPLLALMPIAASAQTADPQSEPALEAQPSPTSPGAIELSPTGDPTGQKPIAQPPSAEATPPAGLPDTADAPAATGGAEGDATKSAVAGDDLIGRNVVAADGKSVGEVAAVKADDAGRVKELHIKTGGFLGFGAKTRVLTPEVFVETPEAIQLRVASTDLNQLPELEANADPKS